MAHGVARPLCMREWCCRVGLASVCVLLVFLADTRSRARFAPAVRRARAPATLPAPLERGHFFFAALCHDEAELIAAWAATVLRSPSFESGIADLRFFTMSPALGARLPAAAARRVVHMPSAGVAIESPYNATDRCSPPALWRDYVVGTMRWALARAAGFRVFVRVELDALVCVETLARAPPPPPPFEFALGFDRKCGYDDTFLALSRGAAEALVRHWNALRLVALRESGSVADADALGGYVGGWPMLGPVLPKLFAWLERDARGGSAPRVRLLSGRGVVRHAEFGGRFGGRDAAAAADLEALVEAHPASICGAHLYTHKVKAAAQLARVWAASAAASHGASATDRAFWETFWRSESSELACEPRLQNAVRRWSEQLIAGVRLRDIQHALGNASTAPRRRRRALRAVKASDGVWSCGDGDPR